MKYVFEHPSHVVSDFSREKDLDLKRKIEMGMEGVTPEEYDTFVLERGRDSFAIAFRDFLKERMEEKKSSLLEVGAGTGIVTNRLNELKNISVTALEYKPDFLEYAIQQARVRPEQGVIGSFDQLPFEAESFDAYTGVAILNQRRNIDVFYAEALRVLKKKGRIYIPWIKTKKESIDREKTYLEQNGFRIVREGDWYLVGEKE